MSKPTKITVDDLHHFEMTSNDVDVLDCVQTKANHYHIIEDHKSFDAEVSKSDFQNKSYDITINNTLYKVKISTDLDELIKQMGFEIGASQHIDSIKAPMPGLILDLHVKVGDHITTNTPILILEAMKMENSILSPRDGVVKSVAVTQGNTVDKGDLLIEFE
ncbi:acetyl-CoA carboxylase biotin carboxyl carrier protein subunit [Formosa haliotis]|uniref:acetyl-CoA carboxylase biotin carboxyl carrier protein subunit n=1 Tax=Formosa haliotis TaxID=1555194 RepID=UPI0008252A7A|nr:acetyl-CoA carboxylase biotin carboxyl carrier protein subunit [Formosa haliotis]